MKQVVVLSDVAVVEIGNPKIQDDVKQKREVQDIEIKTVFLGTYKVLNLEINAKNPIWFDNQI
jgi:hypothetical protein